MPDLYRPVVISRLVEIQISRVGLTEKKAAEVYKFPFFRLEKADYLALGTYLTRNLFNNIATPTLWNLAPPAITNISIDASTPSPPMPVPVPSRNTFP
jgi:hypothetical protein